MVAVHQDVARLETFEVFAVAGDALVEQLVIGFAGVEQLHTGHLQRVHRVVEVSGAHGDVLDAFALVAVQVLLDLAGLLVALFVDRDADLAAGAGHGLALDAGGLALDVEVAHLAEVEQALVEARPFLHASPVHVVRQVVDVGQAVAHGVEGGAGQGLEVHVEEADVADVAGLRTVLAAPAVDEIDDGGANALDGGDVELARAGVLRVTPGAQRNGALVGGFGVLHAERDGAHAGAVQAGKALRKAVGLGVDDEVDFALAVQRDVFVAVFGDGLKAHALEQLAHGGRIGGGVFDELEAVGAHGVVPDGVGVVQCLGLGGIHGVVSCDVEAHQGLGRRPAFTVSGAGLMKAAFYGVVCAQYARFLQNVFYACTGQA